MASRESLRQKTASAKGLSRDPISSFRVRIPVFRSRKRVKVPGNLRDRYSWREGCGEDLRESVTRVTDHGKRETDSGPDSGSGAVKSLSSSNLFRGRGRGTVTLTVTVRVTHQSRP